jgi:hypothetical protein
MAWLRADDLRDIGATTVRHLCKLLEAIAALAQPCTEPDLNLLIANAMPYTGHPEWSAHGYTRQQELANQPSALGT